MGFRHREKFSGYGGSGCHHDKSGFGLSRDMGYACYRRGSGCAHRIFRRDVFSWSTARDHEPFENRKYSLYMDSAVVFTTMHFQFFGFVPRLLMGAMFGYLFNWSRSLWLPIFAHALNNSVVVVSNHFIGGADSDGVNGLGIVENGEIPWAALASLMATAIFLYRFRKYFFIKTKSAIDS